MSVSGSGTCSEMESERSLKEEHARVAQRHRGCLGAPLLAPDDRLVRRRVVLRLLARPEVVLPDRRGRLMPDAVSPAVRRQRRIRELRAGGDELLVHADEVVLAPRRELQDLLAVHLGLLGARELGHVRAARREHLLDRAARDPERSRDRPRAVALFMQSQDRDSCAPVEHRRAPFRAA
ncbi:hypothetical protein WMF27_41350 [Sorangium sp. So ce281]|uniref:hypothetical protein n=1 Tax=unclassified Sorangium TaxID=2621164 RepID=UPI003F608DAB